jgi:hypothetical protein
MEDFNVLAYRTLFLLKDYLAEFNVSQLQPNTVLLGETYYTAIKEMFPEMVVGDRLIYNNKSLEICRTKDDNVLGLAYSYHNEWK